jgi:hypothetical protein
VAGGCTPGDCDCHDLHPLSADQRAALARRAAISTARRVYEAAALAMLAARMREATQRGRARVQRAKRRPARRAGVTP